MLRHLFPVLICCTLFASAAQLGASEHRIATLDIARVLNACDLVEQRRAKAELKQDIQAYNNTMRRFESEIERLQSNLELYDQGSDKYQELMAALKVKNLELKLFTQRNQEQLDQRETDIFRESFEEIRAVLADYAQENDFQLVMLLSPRKAVSRSMRDFSAEIATHVVLYGDPAIDITEPFIAYVNTQLPGDEAGDTEDGDGADEEADEATPPSRPAIDLDEAEEN
ncbi:MAG: OmpH family outer membrane protein [Planctomycetota bacterium]